MTNTDLRTIVIITGLMGCLMSLVLYFLKRNYPHSIKGLGHWAVVPVLGFIASFLYGMQGQWHHWVSMALPNLLVVTSLLALYRGTRAHFNQDAKPLWHPVLLLVSLVFFVVTSGEPAYFVYRLVFVSMVSAGIFAALVPTVWRHRKNSLGAQLMGLTLAGMALITLSRSVLALVVPPPTGIYTYSWAQVVYLSSFGFGMLVLSISAVLLATEQLRSEMQQLMAEMSTLLKHDALTGAMSRRAAFDFGEGEISRCARSGAPFSVLMLDLDHFKTINDTHGHQVGDQVLVAFAQAVESVLRRPAVLGRYGGEEFVALLPDTNLQQAEQVAERIQQHLRSRTESPAMTVSIGVATFLGPQDHLEALLARADAALYAAKRNGRDRIEVDQASLLNRPVGWALPS